MTITIGQNILSIRSQRRFDVATNSLNKSAERLSSGLRINSASDDAAGLAVSSNLKADVRIRSQAIRNVSDGISALSIAEGALSSLSSITTRISELAMQSANGVYTLKQRQALNEEAEALTHEYNRIVSVTSFNGIKLFSNDNSNIFIQAGVGNNAILSIDTLKSLGAAFGDGTFTAGTSFGNVGGAGEAFFVDLNNDGNLDMASVSFTSQLTVRIGNGDGTFQADITYAESGGTGGVFADFNGDGILDYAAARQFEASGISVRLGNGDGSFRQSVTFNSPGVTDEREIFTTDLDNDGDNDLVTRGQGDVLSFYYNNGSGTFTDSGITRSVSGGYVALGDVNHDGNADLMQIINGAQTQIFLGNGNGTFSAGQSIDISGGTTIAKLNLIDVNRDGHLDFITSRGGVMQVAIGNGNGSFTAATSYATNFASEYNFTAGDFNGDGFTDFVGSTWSQTEMRVMYGRGDGTFSTGVTISGLINTWSTQSGDINNDGVDEILSFAQPVSRLQIINPNTEQKADLRYVDILSASGAREALDMMSEYRNRIALQLGDLGAFEIRLKHAKEALSIEKLNFETAFDRIANIDVAEESSQFTKTKILQQISASILTQANLSPQIALKLLEN